MQQQWQGIVGYFVDAKVNTLRLEFLENVLMIGSAVNSFSRSQGGRVNEAQLQVACLVRRFWYFCVIYYNTPLRF